MFRPTQAMSARVSQQLTLVTTFLLLGLLQAAQPTSEQVANLFDAIAANDAATVRQMVLADRGLLTAVDRRQWNEPTVVWAAMPKGREAVLDVLLELGADPNAPNGHGEPAMLGLANQSTDRVREFLAAGGELDAADKYGMTLLHRTCADRRSHAMAKFLLKRGAKVNARSTQGVTQLHVGAAFGAAEFLLPAGAEPNALDWRGRSAAFWARSAEQLEELETAGISLPQADSTGWTLVHEAAWQGNLVLTQWLITRGLAVNVTDVEGATPLHAAARFGNQEIAKALLAAGADLTAKDLRGWTAADVARRRGFTELAAMLDTAENEPAEAVRGATDSGTAVRLQADQPASAASNTDYQVQPGELVLERPTLVCLGFQWYWQGDANRNATCSLEFREAGCDGWLTAYPALRIGGETSGSGWITPHMFAGSVLDLKQGTTYELRLTVQDPDGVAGPAQRELTVSTRQDPTACSDGRTFHVYPAEFSGERLTPQFPSVQAAYAEAGSGDVIQIHAGTHQLDLTLNKQATGERPIVLRGAGDGEAILRGQGNDLIHVDGLRHHIFEDLTFVDADNGFVARGETQALTVRRCRFRDIKVCFFAISPRNRDFLICDNIMQGPVVDWHPRRTEKSQGVWIGGQGHVVCHNRVRGFWDGLSIKGEATDDPELQNSAIDFYNNDLAEFLDDAIEMDYGMHNLRVMRNSIRNSFMGISTQPVYGGPGYIYRNVVYAVSRSPLKLNVNPSGLLIFHNTLIADGAAAQLSSGFQNSRIYNNLFLGRRGEWLLAGGSPSVTTDLDYNGYRIFDTSRDDRKWSINWQRVHPGFSPTGGGLKDSFMAVSLDQFAKLTHLRFERHGGWPVDYGDLLNCPEPDVQADQHDHRPIDLRLGADSRAIDCGKRLASFNDNFTGTAPDLGAYECDRPAPPCGPR